MAKIHSQKQSSQVTLPFGFLAIWFTLSQDGCTLLG